MLTNILTTLNGSKVSDDVNLKNKGLWRLNLNKYIKRANQYGLKNVGHTLTTLHGLYLIKGNEVPDNMQWTLDLNKELIEVWRFFNYRTPDLTVLKR